MELWASAPELYAVTIISPSGEQIPRILVRRGASEQFNFIFEGTTITVDYRIDTKETASQLIFSVLSDRHRDCGRYAFSRS